MKAEVATYIRSASIEQSGHSTMDWQESEIKKYCIENGLQIVRSFSDLGKGGHNFERKGWKDLIKFIESGEHNIKQLVVTSPDRIGRSTSTIVMLQKLNEIGIQVICTQKSSTLVLELMRRNFK